MLKAVNKYPVPFGNMRVAVYYNNQDIRIEERPVPSIGDGELLIKTRAAGICGSDVAEWYRAGKVGKVLGHEIAGEVAAVGAGVKGVKEGDKVSASHHVPCYTCHYCHLGHHTLCDTLRSTNFDPGGFAEWIRLPALNTRYGVYPLGNGISFEEGTFVEPLACTLRAQRKAGVRMEQTILVIGAGMAGLLHIHLAKVLGVAKVIATDINDFRLEAAKQFGADLSLRAPCNGAKQSPEGLPEQIRAANEDRLADVVIVCVGKPNATEQALKCVGRGGTVLFFGLNSPDQTIPLSPFEVFWQKGATLMNSYAASPEEHREVVERMRDRKVSVTPMISHRLPFTEISKGFEMVAQARNSLKVVINF